MEKRIKLIWDFRGPDSKAFAEHHVVHLREFAQKEDLALTEADCFQLGDKHWAAGLVVIESEMIKVRDALKPHRGVLA